MTPSVVDAPATESTVQKIKVSRNLFSLTDFARKSADAEIEFTPVTTLADAQAKLDSEEKLVSIINVGLRRMAINEAKRNMGSEDLVSPKIVSGFVNNFKPLFPLAAETKEAKKDQLDKIYGFIRNNPALLEAIRTIAAATIDAGDDDENETESETE